MVSVDHMLPKIDLEIGHVLIGVENLRRFSESKIGVVFAWHVPKVGSDFRLRTSAPVFDPVCLQPKMEFDTKSTETYRYVKNSSI